VIYLLQERTTRFCQVGRYSQRENVASLNRAVQEQHVVCPLLVRVHLAPNRLVYGQDACSEGSPVFDIYAFRAKYYYSPSSPPGIQADPRDLIEDVERPRRVARSHARQLGKGGGAFAEGAEPCEDLLQRANLLARGVPAGREGDGVGDRVKAGCDVQPGLSVACPFVSGGEEAPVVELPALAPPGEDVVPVVRQRASRPVGVGAPARAVARERLNVG
jgi:hypothetical protein